jgi:hypothetical protein
MASTQRRYSKEEFARRGDAIYENDIRPHLKAEDEGKFVAIDIETGMYEIGMDELEACDQLRAGPQRSDLVKADWLALSLSLRGREL